MVLCRVQLLQIPTGPRFRRLELASKCLPESSGFCAQQGRRPASTNLAPVVRSTCHDRDLHPIRFRVEEIRSRDLAALPENAVWIDLDKPTARGPRGRAARRDRGADPGGMQEIEISSRLYIENSARYMTASLMCAADTESPRITPVTFILSNHRLVTVRYDATETIHAGRETSWRAASRPAPMARPCLLELLDAVIDRCADILERAGADIDAVSHAIFEPEGAARTGHAKRYSDILIAIGRKGDLNFEGSREPGLDRPPSSPSSTAEVGQRQMVEGNAGRS